MDWSRAIASVAIGVTVMFTVGKTREPRCLWALILIPIMYGTL